MNLKNLPVSNVEYNYQSVCSLATMCNDNVCFSSRILNNFCMIYDPANLQQYLVVKFPIVPASDCSTEDSYSERKTSALTFHLVFIIDFTFFLL